MNIVTKTALIGGMFAVSLGFAATASDDSTSDKLIIDGVELATSAAPTGDSPLDTLISGWVFRTPETRALQKDDFENPGMIFVDQARDAWNTAEGSEGKSCADCHGDVESMAGLRTVLPRWNADKGALYTMEDYINESRVEHMGAEPWKYTSGTMQAMVGLISLQSRGLTVAVETGGEAAAMWEQGKEIYYTRVGQLDMACASCHEDNYGVYIRADHLSQGHINGFPAYRLKNTKLNSVHGRFKGCMKNIRATPFKPGGDEFRALELYLASRGNGLPIEGPSVRN